MKRAKVETGTMRVVDILNELQRHPGRREVTARVTGGAVSLYVDTADGPFHVITIPAARQSGPVGAPAPSPRPEPGGEAVG